jgi:hypothetical protein
MAIAHYPLNGTAVLPPLFHCWTFRNEQVILDRPAFVDLRHKSNARNH